jgi:hypothetical protein
VTTQTTDGRGGWQPPQPESNIPPPIEAIRFPEEKPGSLHSNHSGQAEHSYTLAPMYNSHKLPPPSTFAQEHRPLRLTSQPAPPLPTGACRFILLNPSVDNQQCSCQSFHHNRSTPGSVCDCGHQACFHVHQLSALPEGPSTNGQTQYSSSTALLNRIQRLEDALQQERAMRETAVADERRAREQQVRILREALHPFYKSEEEMKRKLIEVEDRIEGTYDEQLRLKDRIVALDDASMALERRLDETEGTQSKKRRTNRQVPNGLSSEVGSGSHSPNSSLSSPLGQSLSLPTSSRAISPTGPTLHVGEHDEPRSSGILNLVNLQEPPPTTRTPREPTPREEVRSSGFLEISLAERLAYKFAATPPRDFATTSPPIQAHAPLQHQSFFNHDTSTNNLPMIISPQMNGATKVASVTSGEVSPTDGTQKKRTWDGELRPLDVLANLSAASPMV